MEKYPIDPLRCSDRAFWLYLLFTSQKMKFSIEDFFSKCDQISRKLRIWSHLLKKSSIENFIFLCSVCHEVETWRSCTEIFQSYACFVCF